jgi:hypothetical protein
MKFAMLLLIGLTVCIASNAFAASATSNLSWTPPDSRQDGTPLSLDEIAEYRVFYTVDGQVTGGSDFIVSSSTATTETVTLELTPREQPYTVSFAITVIDTNGLSSPPSDTVSKQFYVNSTAVPGPATNIKFVITCSDGCTIQEVVTP